MFTRPLSTFEAFLDSLLAPHRKVLEAIRMVGGRPLVVGGSVRDALLGIPPRDLDIEVFHLSSSELEAVLGRFGVPLWRGKAFGVYLLDEVAYALPREERKTGPGHRGFHVTLDPHLSFEASAKRRDLTMNAMAYDPQERRILDPYGGREDMAARRLRVVSVTTFGEDPLRSLRVAQFAARFQMTPDAKLISLCRTLPLAELPVERIQQEMEKLLKAPFPSWGLRFLEQAALVDFLGLSGLPLTTDVEALDALGGENRLLARCALIHLWLMPSALPRASRFLPPVFGKEAAALAHTVRTLWSLVQEKAPRGEGGMLFEKMIPFRLAFDDVRHIYKLFYGQDARPDLERFLQDRSLPPEPEEFAWRVRGDHPLVQALPPQERKKFLQACRWVQYDQKEAGESDIIARVQDLSKKEPL